MIENADRKLITVVTPVFNEEGGLARYREAVTNILFSRDDIDVKVLFVDDGSTDASWSIIERFCQEDQRFRALRLSRNFGAHIALSAGIDHAEGDAVVTLACDLQDPVETVLAFIDQWRAGSDIVWGTRRTRADAGWRVLASHLFFWALRRYAMPRGSRFTTGSFFLIDRKVVKCFRLFRERNRITFALVAWTGFPQTNVYYDRQRRQTGKSGWTLHQMIKALYDTFIGFSNVPSRAVTIIGLAVSFSSVPISIYLVLNWLFSNTVPGWTGIMLAMTLFFGLQFLILGLFGEYLNRIYVETTDRPLYFASDSAGHGFSLDEDP